MKINELESISIIGLGLLGGSLGLAVDRVFPAVTRYGWSHRKSTREKALNAGTVDICSETIAEAVGEAQLVVLASPIGTFPGLMQEMSHVLASGTIVTDVGSTKQLPARWGRTYLPGHVEFLGSHPMAGSEQRGVEFSRADLFEGAYCILTPTPSSEGVTVKLLSDFWEALGMRLSRMAPARHDRVLARISHLPHVLAMALVNASDEEEILLCGKGFLDTTRIASGPPGMWRDILMANAENMDKAIGKLIKELEKTQRALHNKNEKKVMQMLESAQAKRNELVEKKLKRKELPV